MEAKAQTGKGSVIYTCANPHDWRARPWHRAQPWRSPRRALLVDSDGKASAIVFTWVSTVVSAVGL
jgi:hypothetical protein